MNNLGPIYQKVYRIFQSDIQIFKEINGLKKKDITLVCPYIDIQNQKLSPKNHIQTTLTIERANPFMISRGKKIIITFDFHYNYIFGNVSLLILSTTMLLFSMLDLMIS